MEGRRRTEVRVRFDDDGAACDLFYDPLAVQCAAACDGVVLAVRYARNPDPEDDRVVATLEKTGARIIGSVTTSYPGPFARALKKLIKFS